MKNILMCVLLLLTLSACENISERKVAVAAMKFGPPEVLADKEVLNKSDITVPESGSTDTTRKIIKTGELSFEATNLDNTRKKIIRCLKAFGGYVAEESQDNDHDNDRKEFILNLCVPSKKFDQLLDSVTSGVNKIDAREIRVRDVTTEFIDIKTALANKRILEGTYLGLLKKVDKIADVLKIEAKITEIRTTIDSTQGELNYLTKQVAFSTLKITIYTKQIPQIAASDFGFKLRSAWNDGWNGIQSLFLGIISLWPFLILTLFFTMLFKWWLRRRTPKVSR